MHDYLLLVHRYPCGGNTMADRPLPLREWCKQEGISPTKYYQLAAQGLGPRIMRGVGASVLISPEATIDWRRLMETIELPPHNRGRAAVAANKARAARVKAQTK
jgi:hypothetical protein